VQKTPANQTLALSAKRIARSEDKSKLYVYCGLQKGISQDKVISSSELLSAEEISLLVSWLKI